MYNMKTPSALILANMFVDTNECASNPCQNGGTCNDEVNKYSCDCGLGYAGVNCQIGISISFDFQIQFRRDWIVLYYICMWWRLTLA